MNVTAFQLRGLVGPSAGSFIIAFNPSVGIPFSGNATSDVTDPIALLCAVTLDPRKHYTVDISSADAETLHLSSWGFAADDNGDEVIPVRPRTRSASRTGAIVGGVLGGVFGLVAILTICAICWIWCGIRRRRLRRRANHRCEDKREDHELGRISANKRSRGIRPPAPSPRTPPLEAVTMGSEPPELHSRLQVPPLATRSASPRQSSPPFIPPRTTPSGEAPLTPPRATPCSEARMSSFAANNGHSNEGAPDIDSLSSSSISPARSHYGTAASHVEQGEDADTPTGVTIDASML
ncbi:unnamed protein product [Cutaneotrichosporon oleaginosum]